MDGVDESPEEDVTMRIEYDLGNATDILQSLIEDEEPPEIEKVLRLGKKGDRKDKPRLMKIILKSKSAKQTTDIVEHEEAKEYRIQQSLHISRSDSNRKEGEKKTSKGDKGPEGERGTGGGDKGRSHQTDADGAHCRGNLRKSTKSDVFSSTCIYNTYAQLGYKHQLSCFYAKA